MAITALKVRVSGAWVEMPTIAALTPTTDNLVQSVAGAWASRTPAQVKATLALAKADVGLGSVDNTSDLAKPISTATQGALNAKGDMALAGAQTVTGAKTWNIGTLLDKGNIVVSVKTFGAVGDGVADDTVAIQNAIDYILGSNVAAGASATRTPHGVLYLPAGVYKITDSLKIYSALGFNMYGEGDSSQIALSGTLTYGLDIIGVYYGSFRNFTIIGSTVTDTVTNAIGLNRDASKALFTCTGNRFEGVFVRNLKYVRAFALGESSANLQVDQVTLVHCKASGQWVDGETTWWQEGFLSGSGTNGNVLNHHYYHCVSTAHAKNVHGNACQVYAHGITVGNGGTDFHQSGSRAMAIEGCRSETSQRLFVQNGGSSISTSAAFRDITWQSNALHADNRFIMVQYGGAVRLSNIDTGLTATAPVIYISNSSTRSAQITLDGMVTRQALASLFESAGSASPATVTVRGFTQVNSSAQEIDTSSFWAKNFQAFAASELPTFNNGLLLGTATQVLTGTGTPEGVITAPVASVYYRTDGAIGSTLYVKETGSGNTGWSAFLGPDHPNVQYFTTPGTATWTKPTGAKTVDVQIIPGGSGGGSGRRGAAGTIRCGGGGGGAGWMVKRVFDAADVGATVTVTVGAGGGGGPAVTADSTSGNAGSAGGSSSFGTLTSAPPAGGGAGGTATTGTGGGNAAGLSASTNVGSGATASTTGGAGTGTNPNLYGAGAGASGGGITNADVAGNGGLAGGTYLGVTTGGAAGVVDTTAPTSGTAATIKGTPGPGAGGGAASITTAAQAGANAANYGGGGGGGGASLNGNNSGAGGNGAGGSVLVVTYF